MHHLTSPSGHTPNRLLDALLAKTQSHNDAALARVLEVAPPTISKIRERRAPVGTALLLRMQEVTGIKVGELRDLMDDRREPGRPTGAGGQSAASCVQ